MSARQQHQHRWDLPHRGHRWCKLCRQRQYQVAPGEYRDSMTLDQFASKWLPVISGTRPVDMLTVKVAYPFEWNCYETWNVVWRVRFDFTELLGRHEGRLATPVDIMNGWQSKYHEDFCRIDFDAAAYYESRVGRPYDIGDNSYAEMRAIIQAPGPVPKPPELALVDDSEDAS